MIVIDGVEMVDVREAARLSRRTPETIRRWVWSGRLAAIKNGNKLFVPRADVSAEPPAPRQREVTLRDWEARLPSPNAGSGSTARDLVLEDRSRRARR